MAYIDYYGILGISKQASADEIKKAYRKLARKLHPDLNPDDAEANKKFQQLAEAYEVLRNEENRKKYDQYGENWQHAEQYQQASQQRQSQGNQHEYSYGGFDSADFGNGDFSDFFESMFGGARGRGQRQSQFRGQDYNASLSFKLRDVVETTKQTLSVNGKNIRITVPAGVADGQVIKLAGYGAPGVNSGPAGDLFITFQISDDHDFKRLNDDLYKTVEIDVYQAVLGDEITVETLSGKVKVKVGAGTQNGGKARLKGKGMPVYKKDGSFGDLILTYQVKIPTALSEKQKELFEQLAQLK